MFGKQLLAVLLLAAAWQATQAQAQAQDYDVAAYCPLVKPGTKLPSMDSCNSYYICNKNGGYTEAKCDADLAFDKDKQSCEPVSTVSCYYGLDNPCVNKDDVFVPQTGTCRGWIYCKKNKETGRGECPKDLIFVKDECVHGTCSDNNPSETVAICTIMPSTIYFGNTLKCNNYVKCVDGTPITDTCANDWNYDVQNGMCNYKSKTDCSRITGVDIPGSEGTELCSKDMEGKFEANSAKCSAYSKCTNGKLMPLSCGTGLYFDILLNACVARQQAVTVDTCNRCEYSKKTFVNAVDPEDCSKYLICNNGKNTGSGTCPDGYFNEQYGGCMSKDVDPEYRKDNGACYEKIPEAPTACSCAAQDTQAKCNAVTGSDCTCEWANGKCAVPEPTCECETYEEIECKTPTVKDCTCEWANGKCAVPDAAPQLKCECTTYDETKCNAPGVPDCTCEWAGGKCAVPDAAPELKCECTTYDETQCNAPGVPDCTCEWAGGKCAVPDAAPELKCECTTYDETQCNAPGVPDCTCEWAGGKCADPVVPDPVCECEKYTEEICKAQTVEDCTCVWSDEGTCSAA